MRSAFVTGAAGFIGSNLVDRLLEAGVSVTAWDNFSSGQMRFLQYAHSKRNFRMVPGDILDKKALTAAMRGADVVFHLAANADIRYGWEKPDRDLTHNLIGTSNVLDSMRINGVPRMVFTSTAAVYGDTPAAAEEPTREASVFPLQTSLYGASKMASEALVSAYAEGKQILEAYIFRFAAVIGERYTHGHILDFCQQLWAHREYLRVIGNGEQGRSYVYIHDGIDAMLNVIRAGGARAARHRTEIYNVASTDRYKIRDSIQFVCAAMGVSPSIYYGDCIRGWAGDNPCMFIDASKLAATGWRCKISVKNGIVRTARWLRANPWIYAVRD